jgi:hypothetical protein
VTDVAVWGKIKEWTCDEKQLDQEIEDYQSEKDKETEPYRARLAIVDDLLRENQEQLERALDLYLSGDFPKEMLTERKRRLEETAQALEKERATLTAALEARTLTDDQIASIKRLAAIVRQGLAEGDDSFDARREAIESLQPQVRLIKENGQKVAYISCVLGSGIVVVDNMATGSRRRGRGTSRR